MVVLGLHDEAMACLNWLLAVKKSIISHDLINQQSDSIMSDTPIIQPINSFDIRPVWRRNYHGISRLEIIVKWHCCYQLLQQGHPMLCWSLLNSGTPRLCWSLLNSGTPSSSSTQVPSGYTNFKCMFIWMGTASICIFLHLFYIIQITRTLHRLVYQHAKNSVK